MATDEFDVDTGDDGDLDFEFDSLADLPDSDTPDSRKPVEKLAGGFIEGVKSSAKSDTFRRRLIENALPEGYASLHKDLEEGVSLGKDLYDTAAKELQPVGREMKKVGRFLANKTDKFLPKSVSDKLKKWTEPETNAFVGDSKDVMREAEISATLKEVFGEQIKADASNRVADAAVQATRARSQLEYLDLIRSGIDRQVSYQDTITANYQRKSLALKYRSLYLAQDQFDLLRKYVVKTNQQLDSIVHNSALPDFVKTRMSEHAREIMREKLIGKAQESVQQHTAGFVRKLKDKAINKTKNIFSGIAGGIRDAAEGIEMTEDVPIDAMETIGGEAGIYAGDLLGARLGKFIGSKIKGNEKLERIGANLEYITGNKEEFIREALEREINRDNREGFMGLVDMARTTMAESMRDSLPSYTGIGRFDQNISKIAEETAPYTALTDRTIVEIIPGLLSRQLQELEMIRSGKSDVERIEYNFERASFTRESQAKSDIMERIMPTVARESLESSVNDFMSIINKDKVLSRKAESELKKQALYDAADGRAFSPARYGKYHELNQVTDKEARFEIANYFSERYLDEDGEFRKDDYALSKERAEAGRKFSNIRRDMPNYKAETQRLVNIYGTSRMEEAGMIKTDLFGGTSSDVESMLSILGEGGMPQQKPGMKTVKSGMGGVSAPSSITGESASSQYVVDNANALRNSMDKALGQRDTTNDWLMKIHNKMEKWDTNPPGGSPFGGFGPHGPYSPVGGGPKTSFLSKIMSAGQAGIAGGVGMYGKYLGMFGSGASKLKGYAEGLFGSASGKVKDIYLKGSSRAVLLARDLQAGEYRDQLSGDIIKSIEDIKGPVVDRLGNVVISLEDITNGKLSFSNGKEFIVKLGKMAGSLGQAGMSLVGGYYGTIFNLAKAGYNMLSDKLSVVKDIYVDGETVPRVYAKMLESGMYISQKTGKKIYSLKDIDGPVIDLDGNVVLALSDFRKGLVDAAGQRISQVKGLATRLFGGAMSKAKGLIKGAMALGSRAMEGIRGFLSGDGSDGFGFGFGRSKEIDILTEIRDILDERLEPMDGGVRKGSWQERLAAGRRRKALAAAGGLPTKTEGDSSKKKASSLLGLLFGEDSDEEGGNEYSLDADFGDGDDKSRKSRKKRKSRKSGGKKGFLKKIAGGTWNALKKGGSFLGRAAIPAAMAAVPSIVSAATGMVTAGAGALATAGGWLASAAAAVGGVLSAPVVLTVGAIAGAGYLAYKYLYKTPEGPIHRVRLTQYGINPDEKSHLGKISTLEEMLKGHIKYDSDGMATLDDKVNVSEIIETFGIAEGDNARLSSWTKWFQGRFKPIYLSHLSVANQMAPSIELLDIDDNLDPSQAIVYLNRVKFAHDGNSPYSIYDSPFEDIDELPMGSKEVQAAMNAAVAEFKESGGKAVAPNVKTDSTLLTEKAEQTSLKSAAVAAAASGSVNHGAAPSPSTTKSIVNRSLVVGGITIATSTSDRTPIIVKPYSGKVDDFTAIRLLTYGIAALDPEKVGALLALEASVKYDTSISNRTASFKGDQDVYFDRFAIAFGLDQSNETHKATWKIWFANRFIPVYLTYSSALAKLKRAISSENASNGLSNEEKVSIAIEVHMSSVRGPGTPLVWGVKASPWLGYSINTSIESVFPYLNRLKAGRNANAQKNRASSMVGVQPKPLSEKVMQQPTSTQSQNGSDTTSADKAMSDAAAMQQKSPDDVLDVAYTKQKRMSDEVALQQERLNESSNRQLGDIQSILSRSLAVQINMAKSLTEIGHYYRLRWQKDEMEAIEVEDAVNQGSDDSGFFGNFFGGSKSSSSSTPQRTRRAPSNPSASMKA